MPNQCAALGAWRETLGVGGVGLCVMNVEKSAMKTQKSTMTRPTMKVGLRNSALIR